MKYMNIISIIVLIIGGLNWGLVGIADFNLVAALFGADSWFTNLVYIIVGLAALWGFVLFKPLTSTHSTGHRTTR